MRAPLLAAALLHACSAGTPTGTRPSSCTFINSRALDLLKFSEGFVPLPAPDQVGAPTAGYGHQCRSPGCGEIAAWLPLTRQSAHQLLLRDIVPFARALAADISADVLLNDNQWGALVSWAYNVGSTAARESALVHRLNRGEDPQAVIAAELPAWDHVGQGQRLLGLTVRRAAEVTLFNRPSALIAHPYCQAAR
ncbi:hypothetical protein IWQ57_003966 [Coemansia nantahalensis]|uniref:Uncharacterized protein n=1 Tax=Coemansia nantahalensis TaxID=2789366 RepID=A0ACC1JUK8_9FUNG|nr:hypothetical protein IWQ57_003966 [Coemansia nantahalensis]